MCKQDFEKKLNALKARVINNVKSYNKNAKLSTLKKTSISILINMAHPSDRIGFENEYNNL